MWLLPAVVRRPAFRQPSLVTMMESAKLWKGDDLACLCALDRPGDITVPTLGQARARAVAVADGPGLSRFRTATCWRRAMFSSCNVARFRTISQTKATRLTTIICMLQTVADSGLKCQDVCGRRGFEERQVKSGMPIPEVREEISDRFGYDLSQTVDERSF
jgi:hypothetical protein